MRRFLAWAAALAAAAALNGCRDGSSGGSDWQGQQDDGWRTNHYGKVSYLCVGMEESRRFGPCPGCEFDATRMSSIMAGYYRYDGDTLVSERATKANVERALRDGVSRTPEDGLFLFFYSGHGGREALGGKEPDGADREDEYLCLYDAHMLDDEIWSIVSACRGRVFLYFDACHSATMYRGVAAGAASADGSCRAMSGPADGTVSSRGFTFRPERFSRASPMEAAIAPSPRILCWSGCREAEYSYGGRNGGELTIAVVRHWSPGATYEEVWGSASAEVSSQQKTQHPVCTRVGDFPKGLEAFR